LSALLKNGRLTERFKDWVTLLYFRLELIFATAPAASKSNACFKISGPKRLKNNHIASLV